MNMKSALNAVWEGIGPDLLGPEEDGAEFKGKELQHIIADYAETYLWGEEKEAWKAAPWEQRGEWLKEAFPDNQLYGY